MAAAASGKMRCARFISGTAAIEVVEADVPSLEGTPEGTVLVKGLWGSICGTDLLCVKQPRDIDDCPGASFHEAVGQVVAMQGAEEHNGIRVGDRCLALPSNYIISGTYRGVDPELADKLKSIPLTGGLAQYFLSHSSHVFKIPEATTVPLSHYAVAQPIGTVLWMLRKVPNLIGKHTAIVGQGPNGLVLTHLLSNLGAKTVIGIDKVPGNNTGRSTRDAETNGCCTEIPTVSPVQERTAQGGPLMPTDDQVV
eukprot:m.30729 g.30729  ORF g.30729 m.30729 type:complete len:253 (+) comp9529_c0_seq2:128-886(+)